MARTTKRKREDADGTGFEPPAASAITESPFTVDYPTLRTPTSRARNTRSPKLAKLQRGTMTDELSVFGEDLNIAYTVRPEEHWLGMKQYRNFVVGHENFSEHELVLVNHASADASGSLPAHLPEREYWTARVLEIRATDPQNVYLRVHWFYSPPELRDGAKPYHGKDELLPSNHQEVIDAMSVAGKANVRHWKEEDDEPVLEGMYWRQTYAFHTNKLSPVRLHCHCKTAHNPDKIMIGCSNPTCKIWLHQECILRDKLSAIDRRERARDHDHGNTTTTNTHTTPSHDPKTPPAQQRKKKKKKRKSGPVSAAVREKEQRADEDRWNGLFEATIIGVGTDGSEGMGPPKVRITDLRRQEGEESDEHKDGDGDGHEDVDEEKGEEGINGAETTKTIGRKNRVWEEEISCLGCGERIV
ncbi:MAG: hypothetical protein M1817_004992 [Caeruleum heppii]|nr:MAG: hypothetical protein M1817_004992 [Caeruleum heppii]